MYEYIPICDTGLRGIICPLARAESLGCWLGQPGSWDRQPLQPKRFIVMTVELDGLLRENGPLLDYPHTQGTNARLATAAHAAWNTNLVRPSYKKRRKNNFTEGFKIRSAA